MAQGSLQKMSRQIQAYCPSVPITLAQQWVIDRYRSVCENNLWSFKIGEGTFSTPLAYETGTITLTNASATVTGSGTTFTSAMVGRQLKVSGYVFTITAYASGTSITIDRAWGGDTTAGLAYKILQAYIVPSESDFLAFLSVLNPAIPRRLRFNFTSGDIDRKDPQRSSTGDPCLLASRSYNSAASPQPRYELWPHSTTARTFTYTYERRIADLSAATDIPHIIIRSDILVKGALADLARWPGTKQDPNPFYDPYFNQFKSREAEFQAEVAKLLVSDQDIYMTDLTQHTTTTPYMEMPSDWYRSHHF